MIRRFLAILFVSTAGLVSAQEPIRFARTPDISPDGRLLAFSYLGDLWTVSTMGGVAKPVTLHEAHDYLPFFSPDGRHLAFSSNRYGQYDVYVVPVQGGRPKRLTFDSGDDYVTGWTPDGERIVFSSTRSVGYPSNREIYSIPIEGGREHRLNLLEAKDAAFSPNGSRVAFVQGPGHWYRRGYRGSSNDDVWVSLPDGSDPLRITTFDGQDTSPMWSPDNRTLYYVSEQLSKPGCANILSQSMTAAGLPDGKPKALTTHDTDSVRIARLSRNGEWIVYECGAELWVVGTKGQAPRRLAIEVYADDKSNPERTVTYTREATQFALSPDEKHAVIVVHGELFLTSVPNSGKATRLTSNPAFDSNPVWAPDGKSILYTSDRGEVVDLFLLEPDDAEHPELTRAQTFKSKALTNSREEELAATFSPSGDRIAFVKSGRLWTMKPDGSDSKAVVETPRITSYDWSPDGKHFVFSRMDGSYGSEVYIVPSEGGTAVNISRYATYNDDVSWSRTGNTIAFLSTRHSADAMYVVALQKPAIGSARSSGIDWEDIHLRVTRPTSTSAETGVISPDGSQIAFRSKSSGDDLWVVSTNGRSVGRVTSGNQAPTGITWSRKGTSNLIYFLNGKGELKATRAGLTFTGSSGPSGDPISVAFSAEMTIDRQDEYAEMFTQCWRILADRFYDPNHHGVDWKEVRRRYAPLVSHVAEREDFYALISLMLGELNSSHLGISGHPTTPDRFTTELGLIYDDGYKGPGLKIAEILKRGPADRKGLDLKPGDIIVAIDRTRLTEQTNISELLNGKTGQSVRLDVTTKPDDPKATRRVTILGTTRSKISDLMYDRWVEANSNTVAKLSNGRLGYTHIRSMNSDSLEDFMRSLYSDNFDKEGLIVDVRFNGGGFTHDAVLNYLSGKEHTLFRQRNGGTGSVFRNYDRKWTKPVVVLINNRSYSDAEIFPHAFQTLGLGKVVGQATGGAVIGTGTAKLIDGSSFRVPGTGVFSLNQQSLENHGVVPDVPVEITPKDRSRGIDTQLGKAVDVLQTEVAAWMRSRTPHETTPKTVPSGSGGP